MISPADPFFVQSDFKPQLTAAFGRRCDGLDQDCEDFSLDGALGREEKCAFRNFEECAMGLLQADDRRIPTPIGGPLPEPPAFATFEEERRHRKLKLAAAFRIFARFGMAVAGSRH